MSVWRRLDVLRLVSVIGLTLAVLPVPEGFAQDQGDIPSEDADTVTPLDVYQRRLNAAPASIRDKVERLQKQAAEENWGFEPGYTSVLERSVSEITGAKPGLPPEAALAQQRLAGEALRLYGNELAQQKIPPLSQPLERKSCVSAKEFNWAKKKKVSAVRDQGSCGSCWAFAAIGVAESSYLIENARTIDASEQLLLNCTAESSCEGGYVEYAYGQLMANGTVLEKAKQYVGVKRACKPPNGPIQLVTWAPVGADWTEVLSPDIIKQNLCSHGPVVSRMIVDDAFQAFTGGGKAFRQVRGDLNVYSEGAHFVVIIGWDDRKGRRGSWRVKNSWGKGWGDNGFAWVEYGANTIGHSVTWAQAPREGVSLGPAFSSLVEQSLKSTTHISPPTAPDQ